MEDKLLEVQKELLEVSKELKEVMEEAAEDEYKSRILHITGEIEQDNVNAIFESIMEWNHQDKGIDPQEREPIFILINSYGGSVYNGFSLYNLFRSCSTPIIGIVVGVCYSAATLALLGCHLRLAMPNTSLMLHRSRLERWDGDAIDMQQYSKYWNKIEDTLFSLYLENLDITSAELHTHLTGDWWLTPEEAVDLKLCDEILTNLDLLG